MQQLPSSFFRDPVFLLNIKEAAFVDCEALCGDLVIPDSVYVIGPNAFRKTKISSAQCESQNAKLVSIGSGAFYQCDALKNVQFTGLSGFSHNYDFLLQRSKTKPERLCQAVNNPNKSSMGNILFAWNDTKPARRTDSQLIVILNDQNAIAKGIEDAFLNYDAKVVRWSERNKDSNLELFAAS